MGVFVLQNLSKQVQSILQTETPRRFEFGRGARPTERARDKGYRKVLLLTEVMTSKDASFIEGWLIDVYRENPCYNREAGKDSGGGVPVDGVQLVYMCWN